MDDRQPSEEDIAAQGAPASPDALRAIVARHQRARTRTLGIFLAIALVAGPIAGWAVGHSGGGGQQVATGSSTDKSNGANPAAANAPGSAGFVSGQAFAYPDKNPPKVTHLFNRTSSDGIAIRVYRQDPPPQPSDSTPTTTPSAKTQQAPCPMPMTVKPGTPAPEPGAASSGSASGSSGESGTSTAGNPPSGGPPPPPDGPACPPPCEPVPSLLAEFSNEAAVGQGFDPLAEQPAEPAHNFSTAMFGVPEGAPAMFVIMQTGPGTATVRLRLPSGATDEMAPHDGFAVLAHASPSPPPKGTVVEALDGSGKVLASHDVNEQGQKPFATCGGIAGPVRAFQAPAPAAPPTPPTTR